MLHKSLVRRLDLITLQLFVAAEVAHAGQRLISPVLPLRGPAWS